MMKNRIENERKFWDAFSGKYDKHTGKKSKSTYDRLFESFAEDTGETKRLLEIATGTGLISLKLSQQIPDITATDLSPEMIKIARAKAEKQAVRNVNFQVEDACNLGFPGNSYDTIIASNVLHLLFDPALALQEIKRVLTDGGILIAPTYCHGANPGSHVFSRLMGLSGFKARSRWSIGSFQKFIRNNEFEIIKCQRIKGVIPMAYLVARNKPGTHEKEPKSK